MLGMCCMWIIVRGANPMQECTSAVTCMCAVIAAVDSAAVLLGPLLLCVLEPAAKLTDPAPPVPT